jgi:hypothetical protein
MLEDEPTAKLFKIQRSSWTTGSSLKSGFAMHLILAVRAKRRRFQTHWPLDFLKRMEFALSFGKTKATHHENQTQSNSTFPHNLCVCWSPGMGWNLDAAESTRAREH